MIDNKVFLIEQKRFIFGYEASNLKIHLNPEPFFYYKLFMGDLILGTELLKKEGELMLYIQSLQKCLTSPL